MKMQKCRANKRNAKYTFSRTDFLNHFALYVPVSWLSAMTVPVRVSGRRVYSFRKCIHVHVHTLMHTYIHACAFSTGKWSTSLRMS